MQKMLASDVLNLNMRTLEGFSRGVVEDNNSPNGNGECRIRILGVHTPLREQGDEEGIPTDQLPWAQQVTGLGGNATSSVPRIGSYVFCFFENGNPLQPRYFGLAPGTEKGIPKVAYPNVNSFSPNGEAPPPPPEVEQNCDFIGILTRGASTDQGTPGTLVFYTKPKDGSQGKEVPGGRFNTLELPWRNNLGNKSCIPTGNYTCKFRASTGGSPTCANTYQIYGTENAGRAGCRLHGGTYGGNTDLGYKTDIHGCILVDTKGYSTGNPMGKTQTKLGAWDNRSVTQSQIPRILSNKQFVLTIR